MKAKTKTFQSLDVWKEAHQLVLSIYNVSKDFPIEERYGLTSQLRRAAISIPANIAEGYRKLGKADKLRFYNVAQGSLAEVRYFLILTKDLGYADTKKVMLQLESTSKLLNSYCLRIRDDKKP